MPQPILSMQFAPTTCPTRLTAGTGTAVDIRQRAGVRGKRPNIRNTLAEALARIDEMKAGG